MMQCFCQRQRRENRDPVPVIALDIVHERTIFARDDIRPALQRDRRLNPSIVAGFACPPEERVQGIPAPPVNKPTVRAKQAAVAVGIFRVVDLMA
jgi:hypothetical protein